MTWAARVQTALIDQYIEPHPIRSGAADAVVRGTGIPVWALIGMFRLTPGADAADRVAQSYEISPEAMQAAVAYYQQHRASVDARLLRNAEA